MKSVPPTFEKKSVDYYLRMLRGEFSELEETRGLERVAGSSQKNIVILLGSRTLGNGNDELGEKLLKFFLQALIHNRIRPKALILVNEAVRLTLPDSPVVDDLAVLGEQGIRILVCMASADEYDIERQIKVGCVADMDNICDHLLSAWKVIRL